MYHSVDPFKDEEGDEGPRYLAGQESYRALFLHLIAFDGCQLVGVPHLQLLENRLEQVGTWHQVFFAELKTRAQLEVPNLELGRTLRVENVFEDSDPPVLQKITIFFTKIASLRALVRQFEPRYLVFFLFGIDE